MCMPDVFWQFPATHDDAIEFNFIAPIARAQMDDAAVGKGTIVGCDEGEA